MAGNLLAEADGSNNITRYYIHGLGLVAMVTPSDQVYCYHFNAIGSTVAMTDSSQTMVNKYAYDPFGKVTNQEEAISPPFIILITAHTFWLQKYLTSYIVFSNIYAEARHASYRQN